MAVVLTAAFFLAYKLGKQTADRIAAETKAKAIEREVMAKNEIEQHIRDLSAGDIDKRLHQWHRD
jgi:hypothetical protein